MGSLIIGVVLLGLVLVVPLVGWAVVLGLILAGLGGSIIALVAAIAERLRGTKTQVDTTAVEETL